jgi:hypothetical protein
MIQIYMIIVLICLIRDYKYVHYRKGSWTGSLYSGTVCIMFKFFLFNNIQQKKKIERKIDKERKVKSKKKKENKKFFSSKD